jgi:hypothetical protein
MVLKPHAIADACYFSSVTMSNLIPGQPVALFAAHPTFCHPLMDEVLFRILHACPSLQIVVAVSSSFFSHATSPRQRMNWARKLVRRYSYGFTCPFCIFICLYSHSGFGPEGARLYTSASAYFPYPWTTSACCSFCGSRI